MNHLEPKHETIQVLSIEPVQDELKELEPHLEPQSTTATTTVDITATEAVQDDF